LRDGGVVAAGPINEVLTSANISKAFGITIDLSHENGRWFARAL
jgi:iron complex transport system ATP-binding protein